MPALFHIPPLVPERSRSGLNLQAAVLTHASPAATVRLNSPDSQTSNTPRKDAMEYVECPRCMGIARRMPVLSSVNHTDDFYQCDSCRQVLLTPKDESRPPVPFTTQWREHAPRP